jgi:hypothetical protein
MDSAFSTKGEKWNAYRILVEKPKGKRPLGRPRRRWCMPVFSREVLIGLLLSNTRYNTKMGLRQIEWGGIYWINLAQDRDQWRALVNMVINLLVRKYAGKFLSSCTICGFIVAVHTLQRKRIQFTAF